MTETGDVSKVNGWRCPKCDEWFPLLEAVEHCRNHEPEFYFTIERIVLETIIKQQEKREQQG